MGLESLTNLLLLIQNVPQALDISHKQMEEGKCVLAGIEMNRVLSPLGVLAFHSFLTVVAFRHTTAPGTRSF